MRVGFYVPPNPDGNTTPALGPLTLLAVLEQEGIEGRLFDARIAPSALGELVDYRPDIVGISAVTSAYKAGLAAAARARVALPGVRVAVGGPHASALPREVLAEPAADYVVGGEAERSFPALCRLLAAGEPAPTSLRSIAGIAFREQGAPVVNDAPAPLREAELDALPFPAFHRMDLQAYFTGTQTHGMFRRGRRVLPIMTSRGCPSGCTYCCRVMGRRLRTRSPDSVLAEVRELVDRYAIDEINVEDDNFTQDRPRSLEILERLADFTPPLHLKLANGVRADRVDTELLQAMRRARVYSLSFGIESGCPRTLRRMRKGLELGRARESVLLARSLGFLVGANCIIGYPGETLEDIEESLRFFLDLPLDSMAIVNLVPFPGTEVRAECEARGYLTAAAADWDNYYFQINSPIPLIETPELSGEQLVAAVRAAYRRMYLRPSWIARTVRHLSFSQVFQGARTLLGPRHPVR